MLNTGDIKIIRINFKVSEKILINIKCFQVYKKQCHDSLCVINHSFIFVFEVGFIKPILSYSLCSN